ncbi:MAG: hypothetical protein HOP15_14625 [Planctomycetes bacterium]|nr:hypothetical protein [Planctomycetota bacterium]
MKTRASSHLERRQAVLRIFEQEGWGSLELVDDWDGEELEELRTILNEEEFQTLLDQLRDQEDTRR